MNTVEKSARTSGNVTNLDEVRQAKARALEDNASSDVATVEKSTKSSETSILFVISNSSIFPCLHSFGTLEPVKAPVVGVNVAAPSLVPIH